MKRTIKPASGLLVLAVLMSLALSACLPLPPTSQLAPRESAVPQGTETAAPRQLQRPRSRWPLRSHRPRLRLPRLKARGGSW